MTGDTAQPMSTEEVWQLLLTEEARMRRLCYKYASRDPRAQGSREQVKGRAEELYHDVVLVRAHGIMATYDPSKGAAPATHLYSNINWYLYKAVVQSTKRRYASPSLEDTNVADNAEGIDRAALSDASLDVQELLADIDDPGDEQHLHSRILWWTDACGYTRNEIAEHLGISAGQVSAIFREALRRARDIGRDEP